MRGKDKAYGAVLYWGFVLAGGGFLIAGAFVFASLLPFPNGVKGALMGLAGVALIAFVVGLVILISTLLLGLGRTDNHQRKVFRYDNTRVIARYAVTGIGETIFDEMYIDPDDNKVKYYVRLQLPNGESHEFHCNAIIWSHCGEGLQGSALVQGDWIGQFIPAIGDGEGHPYRQEIAEFHRQNL